MLIQVTPLSSLSPQERNSAIAAWKQNLLVEAGHGLVRLPDGRTLRTEELRSADLQPQQLNG